VKRYVEGIAGMKTHVNGYTIPYLGSIILDAKWYFQKCVIAKCHLTLQKERKDLSAGACDGVEGVGVERQLFGSICAWPIS
jgi:hypothetical protein